MTLENVIIIGNGVSGVTLARHIRKLSNHRITVISNETRFFYARTALMYVYMGELTFEDTKPYEDWFWKKNRIDIIEAEVVAIDKTQQTVSLSNGESLAYDKLILATGSRPRTLDWIEEDLKGIQAFYHKQDLDLLEEHAPNNTVCKRAVVVGGGLIGIELVEMLHSRGIHVTFLVREPSFRGGLIPQSESNMISDHIRDWGIDLRVNANLQTIKAHENKRIKSIIIEETQEEIPCDLVCITIGVTPNIELAQSSDIETNMGILVNEYLETNVPQVYAVGNCAEPRNKAYKNKFAANWYTARMMGETLAHTICGNKTAYNPDHLFDAAKFLSIEFQSYGTVNSIAAPGNAQFHWKHELENKSITVEYSKDSHHFLGIHAYGIRLRHEIINRWLAEKQTVHYVLTNLHQANFEIEFSQTYEKEIVSMFHANFENIKG